MRLHDRYLFRELLTPLVFCLGAFLIFGITFFFFSESSTIQDKRLNLIQGLAYCAAGMPAFLVLVLPLLLLLALLYALTQHTRHHELTALQAAGISLWRVCLPYFVVGIAASGLYFTVNEFVVPLSNRWAARILTGHAPPKAAVPTVASLTKRGFSYNRAHRSWFFMGNYDPVNQIIPHPTVNWLRPGGDMVVLKAEYAVYTNGVWTFFDARLINATAKAQIVTNRLAMAEFAETPEDVRLLLKFSASQTLGGDGTSDVSLAELWQLLQRNPGLRPEAIRQVQTEFYGRLAMPWTCLVVVLIAIPFGASTGRRNLFFGVAGSIFIVFGYIVLQRISLAMGSNGQLPAWLAAWLPNLLFAAVGATLTLRVR